MSPIVLFSIILVTATTCLGIYEQGHTPDVDHNQPIAFAFGIFVRLMLVVVMMVVASIGMASILISL